MYKQTDRPQTNQKCTDFIGTLISVDKSFSSTFLNVRQTRGFYNALKASRLMNNNLDKKNIAKLRTDKSKDWLG